MQTETLRKQISEVGDAWVISFLVLGRWTLGSSLEGPRASVFIAQDVTLHLAEQSVEAMSRKAGAAGAP